ncbi:MAG: hypothetical protein C4327_08360 [Meiothermus sp.]
MGEQPNFSGSIVDWAKGDAIAPADGGFFATMLGTGDPEGTTVGKDQIKTPVKLLFEINTKGFENGIRASGAGYTTPTPSFRVRLDCQK